MKRFKISLPSELRDWLGVCSRRSGRSISWEICETLRLAAEAGRDAFVRLSDFEEALLEITEAKGAFKMDPHEHAKSVIHDMHQTAVAVLKKHGLAPRRETVD